MRTKGTTYALRDAREEWGEFRPSTIEALIFVGKVTKSTEVRPDTGGPWLPIVQFPELTQLFENVANGGEGKAKETRKATPPPEQALVRPPALQSPPAASIAAMNMPAAAGPTLVPPTVLQLQKAPSGVIPEQVSTVAPPAGGGVGGTYKAICCADGSMIGPLALPLMLAHIWDGRIGAADLVSKDAGKWMAAAQLPELARAFEKAGVSDPAVAGAAPASPAPVTTAPTPQPQLPTPPTLAAVLPPTLTPTRSASPSTPEAAFPTNQPALPAGGSVSLPPPRRTRPNAGDRSATPGQGVTHPGPLLPPPEPAPMPAGPLITPPPASVEDEIATTVMSKRELADHLAEVAKPRAVRLGDHEKALFQGRLEAAPLLKTMGRILRSSLSGVLILEGPYRLTYRCRQGEIIGATRDPHAEETEIAAAKLLNIPETSIEIAQGTEATLLAGLVAAEAMDTKLARSMRSLVAFEEALAPFSWRNGAYAFVETTEGDEPDFRIHPYHLLRAAILTGVTKEEIETSVRGWINASIAPGIPATTNQLLQTELLPLTKEERQILSLIGTESTFVQAVEHAQQKLNHPRQAVLNTYYLAYHLGLLTLVSGKTSSAEGPVGFFDPSLPLDVLARNIQEADFFNLLGLSRAQEPTPGEVDAAFQRVKTQIRQFTGDPKQIEKILARVEKAHRVLVDPRTRNMYLEGGERAVDPGLASRSGDAGVRVTITSPRAVTPLPRTEVAAVETTKATPPTKTKSSSTSDSHNVPKLEALQAQQFEKARKHLDAKQHADALLLLRQLVKVAPTVGKYQATLAWAAFQDSKQTPPDLQAAQTALEHAYNLDNEWADSLYYLGVIQLKQSATKKARQSLSRALQLQPDHALAKDALAKLEAASKSSGGADRGKLIISISVFAVVFGVLFFVANFLGHDPNSEIDGFAAQEYYYHPTSWFFYARRGLLILLGGLGAFLLFRWESPKNLISTGFYGILFGVVFGYLSASLYTVHFPKDEVPPVYAVMLLVVLHACADELFFRGTIARAILPFFDQLLPGALVASFIYGIYHLSYLGYWWGLHYFHPGMLLGSMPIQIVSVSITIGLPLTLLYGRSRSIIPGILAQIAFGWMFILLSISRING